MKKLVVGSFAFVFALVLSTSAFARTLEITEYCGENGLINRGEGNQVQLGDILNVKNNITQSPNAESNWVLGSWSGIGDVIINGNGHTFDGNGYGGFRMEAYTSGLNNESTINNATLTNYNDNEGVVHVYDNYEASNTLNLVDVDIVNNTSSAIYTGYSGAIVNVISKNRNVLISSNTGDIVNNCLMNFEGNKITVKDNFSGNGTIVVKAKNLEIGGDNNDNFNGSLRVEGGTVSLLPEASYLGGNTHNFYKNGTLNLANNYIDDNVSLQDLELSGTMNLCFDVDLAAGDIDDVTFGNIYTNEQNAQGNSVGGKIVINKINILKDAENKVTKFDFGEENHVDYIELASNQKQVLGTLFIYNVSYGEQDKSVSNDNNGNGNNVVQPQQPYNPATSNPAGTGNDKTNFLQFERQGNDDNVSLDSGRKIKGPLNPVFLQSKVAIAASNISQEEVFDTVLNNAGNYTFFQKQGSNAGDVEDRAAPTLWIKAFGSQEDVDMEDYTKVKTTYYGAVVGLDWDRQYTDNFDATYGLFASYISGEVKDEDWSDSEGDFKVKENGGYIGLRGNWYIGKLFVNGIIDYGMLSNNANNPYDSNDFNSSVIGLAARVGYNFEVARRSFTIQPSLGLTGKYILSDDFETKLKDERKIKEEIDDITNITIEPGLKLALNLGKCWILTGEGKYVVENFSGDTKVKGEGLDFVLPDVSYKNYANCGLGIEKIWGYTVLHVKGNKTFGGRDGFIINAGIEFKF